MTPEPNQRGETGDPLSPPCPTNKTPASGHEGPARAIPDKRRKTRDVYALLADFGDGFGLRETGRWTNDWPEMRQVLEDSRKGGEAKRYSYRRRRIKILDK